MFIFSFSCFFGTDVFSPFRMLCGFAAELYRSVNKPMEGGFRLPELVGILVLLDAAVVGEYFSVSRGSSL